MKSGREATWAAWLQQTGDDEGHVVYHPQHDLYGIYWRRSVDITRVLPSIEIMAGDRFPFRRLPADVREYVINHPSKMLLDEQELLNRLDTRWRSTELSMGNCGQSGSFASVGRITWPNITEKSGSRSQENRSHLPRR
jgi:hypothetical protein